MRLNLRLLPQTRHGTWALAAVVWLGGCAIIWTWVPGVPRLVVSADGAFSANFTADGRWVVGRDNYSNAPDVPFRVWDPVTGRQVSSWRKPEGATVVPDGWSDLFGQYAVVLFTEDSADGQRTYLYDLVAGRREPLPKGDSPWTWRKGIGMAYLAVGGRYLVYETGSPDSPKVCWWDRTAERMGGEFPGLNLLAVKPDGRWLTTEWPKREGDPQTFVVREPCSSRECGRIIGPQGYRAEVLPAGDFILFVTSADWQLFELSSGRPCLPRQRGCLLAVDPDRRQVVSLQSDGAGEWLVRWDLITGQKIGRRRFPAGYSLGSPITLGTRLTFWESQNATVASIRQFLASLPLIGRFIDPFGPATQMIYDAMTDSETGTITSRSVVCIEVTSKSGVSLTSGRSLSPDGRTLVCVARGGRLEFWDIPPRKPLSWFAVAAGVWALPVAWFARRRVRRGLAV